MFGKYDKYGNVICQECGKPFKQITDRHLKISHKISLRDYVKKYSGFPLTKANLGKIEMDDEVTVIVRGPDGKQRYVTATVKDFFTDKVKTYLKDIFKADDQLKVVDGKLIDRGIEINTNMFVENKGPAFDSKEVIVKFLKTKFSDIRNNYVIEYLSPKGLSVFKYTTDMALVSKRISLEFPEAFWHNDASSIPNVWKKNKDLRSIGWTVLRIPGKSINKKEVYKKIRTRLNELGIK
jgi:hypothetical protein